jgi:hypothetical protein
MTSGSDPTPQGPPKIILPGGEDIREKKADESWKEKAQKEKEKLASKEKESAGPQQLPPASFLGLVEDLALRAMMALGQFRDPGTNEVYLDLEGAKYVIDLLAVLETKTKGNLDANEAAAVKDLLHNLRMTFVHISKTVAAAEAAQAAGELKAGPKPAAAAPEKPGPKIIL